MAARTRAIRFDTCRCSPARFPWRARGQRVGKPGPALRPRRGLAACRGAQPLPPAGRARRNGAVAGNVRRAASREYGDARPFVIARSRDSGDDAIQRAGNEGVDARAWIASALRCRAPRNDDEESSIPGVIATASAPDARCCGGACETGGLSRIRRCAPFVIARSRESGDDAIPNPGNEGVDAFPWIASALLCRAPRNDDAAGFPLIL